MKEFASTLSYTKDFKIMILDAMKNDLPEEYPLYRLPQIVFSPKEKENYTPIIWWTTDYKLKGLRAFLRKYSKEFPKIDKVITK
jgi:hypothetical protein